MTDRLDHLEKPIAPSPPRVRISKREGVFLTVLLIFALTLRVTFREGVVSGASMEPTYTNNTMVFILKTYPRNRLKPGDVIIFRDKDGSELIKRIAFIRPWQTEQPKGDYISPLSGLKIPYSFLVGDYFKRVHTHKIPAPPSQNRVWVFGDNLAVSDDSRSFGPISPDQILGKVVP